MKKAVAVACAGAFAAALATSLVGVSLPAITRDFGVTERAASWVLSGYLLAISCLLPLAGRASDVLGRKRVFLTGILFFVSGAAMCSAAPTFAALVGARVFQGVGSSMTMAVGPAIITRAGPPSQRARLLGISLGVTYVGLSLGPSLGGVLVSAIGWQAVFVVIAGGGAIAGALGLAWLERDEPEDTSVRTIDFGGAALFALALGAVLYGMRLGPEQGWTSRPVIGIVLFSLVAFYSFVRNEDAHPSPLVPLSMLRDPTLGLSVLSAATLYLVVFIVSFLVPFHLQHTWALTPARAGILMTAQPTVMAVTAPMSGVFADRFGPRVPATAGMLAIAAGILGVRAASGEIAIVVSLSVIGLGAGLFVAPNNAVIMSAASKERQGTAAALAATARNVGMTCGIAIAASLQSVVGFRGALVVAACIAVANALLSARRHRPAPI